MIYYLLGLTIYVKTPNKELLFFHFSTQKMRISNRQNHDFNESWRISYMEVLTTIFYNRRDYKRPDELVKIIVEDILKEI